MENPEPSALERWNTVYTEQGVYPNGLDKPHFRERGTGGPVNALGS